MYTTPIVAQDVSAFVLVGKCMPNYIREIQTYNVCDAWLTRRDLGFYYTEWLPDIIMQERWLMLHLIVQLRHVTCEKTVLMCYDCAIISIMPLLLLLSVHKAT